MAPVFLEWDDAFCVGHDGLDVEHRRLVEIINQIAGIEPGENSLRLSSLLTLLHSVALDHFRHENSVMRDIIAGGYQPRAGHQIHISEARLNEHCAEHAREIILLEDMRHAIDLGSVSTAAASACCLKDWFVCHALEHDVHLRSVFEGTLEKPAPVRRLYKSPPAKFQTILIWIG